MNASFIRSSLEVPYFHHNMALKNLVLAAGKRETVDSKKTWLQSTILMSLMWDNVTEINFNIFGQEKIRKHLGSKIMEVNRCRPAASNENILANRQEFFLTNVAPMQSITDIVLLDFWLMLLYWMFISFYATIYFFVKKFIFPNLYISMNAIFECLYMIFCLRKGNQLCNFVTIEGKERECHPKHIQLRIAGESITPNMYVRTSNISFHVLDNILVL